MKTSAEYRGFARESLKDNWGTAILVCLIVVAISTIFGFIPIVGSIVVMLLSGQLIVAEIIYFSKLNNKQNPTVSTLFIDFGKNWINNFLTYIVKMIYTVLWLLLFIVPGIIKNFSYAMTMYLKSINPQLNTNEAITLSRKMMDGNKWSLACLQFSFIGWIILSILTFGIGFIFLIPYMKAAEVAFYEDVYNQYQQNNIKEIEDDSETIVVNEENV